MQVTEVTVVNQPHQGQITKRPSNNLLGISQTDLFKNIFNPASPDYKMKHVLF
jgi:hypothetical protein